MIFLTIIAKETIKYKPGRWDADAGRWWDEPDMWYKDISRHIFVYSPDKEKLIFPINISWTNKYGIKLRKSLYKLDNFIHISQFKLNENEVSEKNISNPELRYDPKGICQYVDVENTIKLCNTLNKFLDYLLYVPCLQVDPDTVSPPKRTSLKDGSSMEEIYPNFFPNPICRISNLNDCVMREVKQKDFKGVYLEKLKNKGSKYKFVRHITWSEIRDEIIDDYLSGKLDPLNEDEIKNYEQLCQDKENEEEKLNYKIKKGLI